MTCLHTNKCIRVGTHKQQRLSRERCVGGRYEYVFPTPPLAFIPAAKHAARVSPSIFKERKTAMHGVVSTDPPHMKTSPNATLSRTAWLTVPLSAVLPQQVGSFKATIFYCRSL